MVLELIKIYQDTKAFLQTTHSPKEKLIKIINFFKECHNLNHFPPSDSFLIEFTPIIINIFKTSSINYIPPDYFESTKTILTLAKNYYKEEIMLSQIDITIDYINMHLLKIYFYLGEYDSGLIILQNMVSDNINKFSKQDEIKPDFSKSEPQTEDADNKYAIISKEFLTKPRSLQILEEIKYELERLNSFSSDEINVLLVDETNTKNPSENYGVIHSLSCNIVKSKNRKIKIHFENITDLKDDVLFDSIGNLPHALQKLISKYDHKSIQDNLAVHLLFNASIGVYKGSSFLLPASILVFCKYQKFTNNINNYEINSSAAFTSSLDESANIIMLPYDSLRTKISTAFFSWIKYVIIPMANYNDALEILNELHRKYPKKELKLIGVKNIYEIFENKEVIRCKKDSFYTHTKKQIKNNSVISITVLFLFIIFFGVFVALKILPNELKPLPKPDAEMSLIYAPDRDTSWIFRNENILGNDTIYMGDVAIGDYWSPKIEFWNNSRKPTEFKIDIEGKDKGEFEVLWRDEGNQKESPVLRPDFMQRLYIKFRPLEYNKLGEKEANILVYPVSEPENKKIIFLKGCAVRYKNGYSLLFDNSNKQLVLKNNKNILSDIFAIEFWIKPLQISLNGDYWILNNEDGTNNKFNISITNDSLVNIPIYENKASDRVNILKSKEKIQFNAWNHIVFVYDKGNVKLALNNVESYCFFSNNPIKNIPDRIFIGGTKGPEKRKTEIFDDSGFKFLLYGLKIWNGPNHARINDTRAYNDENIDADYLILKYDFQEMNFESVYDLSKNDNWATLYGGLTRIMDSPFNKEKIQYSNSGSNRVLRLKNRGTTFSPKNLFNKFTSFTIQLDARYLLKDTTSREYLFSISHPENSIDIIIYYNRFYAIYSDNIRNFKIEQTKPFIADTKWHRYTICYSVENDYIKIYYDGREIVSFESLSHKYDISRWFYGLSFGNKSFFYSPRFINSETTIDNIKVFNRVISQDEIYSENKSGVLAYWSFENIDRELVFDEINNLPLFMFEDYELLNEEYLVNKP